MKFSLLLLLLAVKGLAFSQVIVQTAPQQRAANPSVRLNVYTTYAFNDKVDSYYSSTDYFKGTIKGGFQWGGTLEAKVQSQSLELSYLRISSTFPVEYYDGGVKHATPNLASNYILLGSNRYLPVNPKIEPYGGLSLGMCVYHASNTDNGKSANLTKFAWGVKGGLNIWATNKIAVKLHAGLISVVQSIGSSLYFGTGGPGVGVSSYSSVFQFTLGGGFAFKINGN